MAYGGESVFRFHAHGTENVKLFVLFVTQFVTQLMGQEE